MTVAIWPNPVTGRFYSSTLGTGALTTLTVTQDILYATPIFISSTITATSIGIEVTTFSAGNVRCGIYTDVAGVPTTLLVDSGAISTGTSNGFKSAVISQILTPAWYWLAALFSVTPGVRAMTTASSLHLLGATSGTDTVIHTGVTVAQAYGALPTPFTGGSALSTVNFPRIMITS